MGTETVVQAPKVEAPPAAPAPAAPVAAAPPAAPAKESAPPATEKAAWMTPPPAKEGAPPAASAPAGEKPKEPAAAAPQKFELKAPEGTSVDSAVLEKFGTEMKALGISQDQAQKLLERDLTAQKVRAQADGDFMKAKDGEWLGEVKNTWGTAKFAENSEHAKRGFDFLDPDGTMRKDMEQAGLAHWPKMVYAAERLGRAIGEDKIGVRTETTRSIEGKKNPEQALRDGYRDAAQKAAKK